MVVALRLLAEGRTRIFERARSEWDPHWYMVIYFFDLGMGAAVR